MVRPLFDPLLAPFVGDLFERMDDDQVLDWLERSSLVEFDAGRPRPLAEALSLIELLRRHPTILGQGQGQVLAFEHGGATQWLLADSLAHARQLVSDIGGVVVGCHPVTDVVRDQFDGIALLGTFG